MPIADQPHVEQVIDWPGIRAAAVALNSVRDAAMRAARNLDPDDQRRFVERVNKRAYRERWLDVSDALSKSEKPAVQTLSKPVQTGANLLQNALAELGDKCRTSAMRGAAKALGHWEGQAPKDALASSKQAKEAVGVAAIAGGWQQAGVQVGVQVNIDGLEVR